MIIEKFISYLKFWEKRDPSSPKPDLNLRMMHGINRISIMVFLVAVIIMIVRAISHK